MKTPNVQLNAEEMVEQQYRSVDAALHAAARALRWLRSRRHIGVTPPAGIQQKMKLLEMGTGGGRRIKV